LASRLRLISRPFSSGSQAIGADLADLEKLESVVIATEQALAGHADILVNSAAVFEYDTLKSVSASSLRRPLEVNVTAAVLLTRFVTRHTSRNEPGLILNILEYKIHNPFPISCPIRSRSTQCTVSLRSQLGIWPLTGASVPLRRDTRSQDLNNHQSISRGHMIRSLSSGAQLRRISGRPLCVGAGTESHGTGAHCRWGSPHGGSGSRLHVQRRVLSSSARSRWST